MRNAIKGAAFATVVAVLHAATAAHLYSQGAAAFVITLVAVSGAAASWAVLIMWMVSDD